MQMQIDPNKLFQLFEETESTIDSEQFYRIKRVYDAIFSNGESSGIDFSSFTQQDVEDTLEDLSSYTTPDNRYNSNNPDNIGVVLAEMNQSSDVISLVAELSPAKIPLEFF